MENKIKAIISEMFMVESSQIKHDSGVLKGDINNWDSFGQLQLILVIEETFGVKFSMKEMQLLEDFTAIVAEVKKK